MHKRLLLCFLALSAALPLLAQTEDVPENIPEDQPAQTFGTGVRLVFYRYKKPEITDGDTLWTYLMPELPVYAPLKFKTAKEKKRYDRLVYNVKRVLPLAQKVNAILQETYLTLETLPNKKAKDEHIKAVEREIKRVYTPEMKKLTFSQGKLLIKLVDRECNQEAYEIVEAFLGPARAMFYQIFAWTFKASLKKEYDPEGEDRMVERIVRQIETGQL